MRISIMGSGIVGYAVGKGLVQLGNDVMFFDINKDRVESIMAEGFQVTTDIKAALDNSDIFFICVPTPTKNREIDLNIIKSVISDSAELLKTRNDYFLMVIKSTVIPRTIEDVVIPLIEEHSGKKVGQDFGICCNPEFLRAEYAYEDFMDPDRIVIGEYDKSSGDILEKLFKPFKCPIIRTNLRTAEMIKYANNCFYATKISFFNEVHLISSKLGIDSNVVRKAIQLDKYYSTHPWFHGSCFGGECLPKDLEAMITFCNDGHVHDPVLLKSVWMVNELIKKENSRPE